VGGGAGSLRRGATSGHSARAGRPDARMPGDRIDEMVNLLTPFDRRPTCHTNIHLSSLDLCDRPHATAPTLAAQPRPPVSPTPGYAHPDSTTAPAIPVLLAMAPSSRASNP